MKEFPVPGRNMNKTQNTIGFRQWWENPWALERRLSTKDKDETLWTSALWSAETETQRRIFSVVQALVQWKTHCEKYRTGSCFSDDWHEVRWIAKTKSTKKVKRQAKWIALTSQSTLQAADETFAAGCWKNSIFASLLKAFRQPNQIPKYNFANLSVF